MTTAPSTSGRLLPAPHSPVVPPQRAAGANAHLNSRFADDVWSLAPLIENPSTGTSSIHWRNCPEPFQAELRLLVWTLINKELRPTFLRERARTLRSRTSVAGTTTTVRVWMHLARWLTGRGLDTLADCDSGVLDAYATHLRERGGSRSSVAQALLALTRLWAFDELTARPVGIGRPPWDEHGVDDYLPAATTRGGENATEAIAETTMGPLLVWAMRMVDDLADDILAAWAEHQQVPVVAKATTPTETGLAALDAYTHRLDATGALVPVIRYRGRIVLARQYIAVLTGASMDQVNLYAKRGLTRAARLRPGPCPLRTPIRGTVHGQPWREAVNLDEAATLMRHLGTACFIVIAYLTGMRPGEVLGLHTGCCPNPPPEPDGNPGRHLIRGREFKTARDEDGNHLSRGTERALPWVAIAPVVNAIRVLERMVPDGHLLFDSRTHHFATVRPATGSLVAGAMVRRIEDFITWANTEAARHGLARETIPPDPHGRVASARFRRTLAWHIARRPGGLVALAIQYGHLRTTISAGYASRSRDGIHVLLDIETVRAVGDTVTGLHQHLEDGGGISGPAARRAIQAAARAPEFAGTVITATTARRYLANDDLLIYDNPHTLLMCVYKRDQALCHRDSAAATPTLDHCVAGCPNIARTDHHADHLRDRARALARKAAHLPVPLAQRLTTTAERLDALADRHHFDRQILQEGP
ncbi:integrase [Streptomyces kaniharaensis]|uniref:Integrase n=1 Tax=Streptomyces kaniharaensis TaxID=212423 RepID=A0A6N7KX85_9ACTN|nr:integrase [Streptomyces kaniharaensis]MQS16296.1 integrase [Streptomyces kaniharaensis]